MANIFITGSAGFIGFHLAQLFLKHNFEVYGVDNLYEDENFQMKMKRLKNLSESRNYHHFNHSIQHAKADLQELLKEIKPEIIIHLAAKTGVRESEEKADYYFESNILATKVVLELASNQRIPLIYASSSSVYGATENDFLVESQSINKPLSIYAITKIANENLAHYYTQKYKLNTVGLRFFTVYGPYSRMDMACWKFINNIYHGKPIEVFGEGGLKRDFTFVDDIAEGIYKVSQSMKEGKVYENEIFNFGFGHGREVTELINIIEKCLSKKAIRSNKNKMHEDMQATLADNNKALTLLGFKPQFTLEEGIEKTVKWYLNP